MWRGDEHVPEQRLGGRGFGLHELGVLAATIEHLVHNEAIKRLQGSNNPGHWGKQKGEKWRTIKAVKMEFYIVEHVPTSRGIILNLSRSP